MWIGKQLPAPSKLFIDVSPAWPCTQPPGPSKCLFIDVPPVWTGTQPPAPCTSLFTDVPPVWTVQYHLLQVNVCSLMFHLHDQVHSLLLQVNICSLMFYLSKQIHSHLVQVNVCSLMFHLCEQVHSHLLQAAGTVQGSLQTSAEWFHYSGGIHEKVQGMCWASCNSDTGVQQTQEWRGSQIVTRKCLEKQTCDSSWRMGFINTKCC